MSRPFSVRSAALVLCAGLALSGCKSKEEKAEAFYRSAEELLAQGDVPRALVELRNVFDYDSSHQQARRLYADILLQQGRLQEAYSQYLRLSEQYPDLADIHRILAELSLRSGNLTGARDQTRRTLELLPDDPGARAVSVALSLRAAMARSDRGAYAEIAKAAERLTQEAPDVPTAWHVLIDARNAAGDREGALDALDAALTREPRQYRLQVLRLELLSELNRTDKIGAQLETMQTLFPDDPKTRTALVAWYVLRDDPEGAARFLRRLATDPQSQTEGYVELVRFLARARGADAAARELDKLITESQGKPNEGIFSAMRADLAFRAGRKDDALTRMKALLTRLPEGEERGRMRVAYARMLDAAGQSDAARAEIETVLKATPLNVPALQQRASWAIASDNFDAAIVDLRTALQQDPTNPDTLTLMAEADLREGAPDLARARFAQAYEAANHAAPEAIRYADFLLSQDRSKAARDLLAEAAQRNPGTPGILQRQADLALRDNDWPQAHAIADQLAALGLPETEALAQSIRAAILMGRGRTDNAIETLKSLAAANGGGDMAVAAVVQAQIGAGRAGAARAYLDEQLTRRPEDRGLRMLSANLAAMLGDPQSAEAGLRALMSEAPADPAPARQLYRLLAAQGKETEAAEVIAQALKSAPQADPVLLLYRARSEEKSGDFDAAIATYEDLYARDSGDLIVANNLASLLSQHRDDKASLERAARIAKRFRERPEPAFKDTYGWAEFRRGDYKTAMPLLAAAAAGMPEVALAQYHYAMALAATGEREEAARVLAQAVALAGDRLPAQMADAPATLEKLREAP
ncbi:MAG: tetratricopeptide repeat protein [Thioclava sp.]|nr:tetratricopeptide repeat protein [Thioclava sp.]MBD3802061.1 tetratricopeptide repeat protein [Thioclava sp.]